jgi:two-component system chemotaxis response regulator CheY
MRILIAEDDFISRKILGKLLAPYGDCDMAKNGREAVDVLRTAMDEGKPYDLVCLDIMMPEMDGLEVLKIVREMERETGVGKEKEAKIIMTTALDAPKDLLEVFHREGCTGYLVKPVDSQKLASMLQEYGPA